MGSESLFLSGLLVIAGEDGLEVIKILLTDIMGEENLDIGAKTAQP